jgi:hypothetical protein
MMTVVVVLGVVIGGVVKIVVAYGCSTAERDSGSV